MNQEKGKYFERAETVKNRIVCKGPVIESFFDTTTDFENDWPREVIDDESFIAQIENRRKLITTVERVISKLPQQDVSLEQAFADGLITKEELVRLYAGLSELLESKLDYERIILYLPFEFLPDVSKRQESSELQSSIDHFKSAYMTAWRSLLTAHDVRANFVDGDVPELALRDGDLPRVVKAAHLIPILVSKGFVQIDELVQYMNTTDDPVLRQNIGEAFLVLADRGIVSPELLPHDLIIQKHAQDVAMVTERRQKWLDEQYAKKSTQPLTQPKEGVERLRETYTKNAEGIATEIQQIQDALLSMAADEEISHSVYPVVMISGSRLKGYGDKESDLDIGVFMKPEAKPEDRLFLKDKIREYFARVKKVSDPVEFWLDTDAQSLRIKSVDSDPLVGESFQVQFLFGSIWEGNEEAIRELREKLLMRYLYKTDEKIYGQHARKMYLGELERDTLQYRLMHKGYERFFPPRGGIHTASADRIDGQSMFWDSGYRQLATQLFLRRVFFPQISQT